MNEIEKLTTAQLRLLRWLHDAGGVGFLDQWGRVTAKGESQKQTSNGAWLVLVSRGLVAGGDRRLYVTASASCQLNRLPRAAN